LERSTGWISFRGRMDRKTYTRKFLLAFAAGIFTLGAAVFLIVAFGVLSFSTAIEENFYITTLADTAIACLLFAAVNAAVAQLSLGVRRLRDLGRSPFWVLPAGVLFCVPLLLLCLIEGTAATEISEEMPVTRTAPPLHNGWITFTGRIKRHEYIQKLLSLTIVGLALQLVINQLADPDEYLALGFLTVITLLVLIITIATLSLVVRRLRDINRSPWWVLTAFLGLPYAIIAIALCFKKSRW
jgi:uncharacterized membrane protein YhaH (DUF805 family)